MRLVLLAVALATPALANEIAVRGPDPEVVRPGDRASLVVVAAAGEGEPTLATLPEIDGVEISAGPPRRAAVQALIGGRIVDGERVLWEIALRPRREGVFDVPPIHVRIAGRDDASEPRRLEARADDSRDPRAFVELVSDDPAPFVGEPVRLRLRFGLERHFLETDVVPLFGRRLDVPVQVRAQALETLAHMQPLESDARRATFALGDRELEAAVRDDVVRNGLAFSTFETEWRLVPIESGPLAIAPPHLRFAYATRFEESVIDGRVPADRREGLVTGRGLDLDVRPLPAEGRPPEFTGAVGRFAMTASAEPRSVEAGESVRLSLAIEGDGDLELFEPPSLAGLEGFHVRGRIESSGDRRRTVIYDVAPLDARVAEIPPIAFATFDPTEPAGYRRVATAAIPLDVRGPRGTSAPARSPEASAPAPSRTRPSSENLGDVPPDSPSTTIVLGIAGAAALGVAALVAARRTFRRAPTVEATRRPAPSAARLRARLRDDGADVSEAFAEYLATRLDVPAAAVVAPNLRARLEARGVTSDLAARAARALDALVAARYGSPDPAPPADAIAGLAAELDEAFDGRAAS